MFSFRVKFRFVSVIVKEKLKKTVFDCATNCLAVDLIRSNIIMKENRKMFNEAGNKFDREFLLGTAQ